MPLVPGRATADHVLMSRRVAMRIILVLVAANAALGVFVLLGGEMGETEGRVFATSLLVTMGVTLALICAPAAAAGRAGWWPRLGMTAAAIASIAFIAAVWTDAPEGLLRSGSVALSWAVAAALVSVLSAWPGSGRLAWVFVAAAVLAAIAAAMSSAGAIFEIDNEWYWRLFGVTMVLLASAAIATPIVHRMGPSETVEGDFRVCPYCGGPMTGRHDVAVRCPRCGRSFTIVPGVTPRRS
jgi:MFS family permease